MIELMDVYTYLTTTEYLSFNSLYSKPWICLYSNTRSLPQHLNLLQ